MSRPKGITIWKLMAAVAMIVFLITLLIGFLLRPSLGGSGMTSRTICAMNLKGQGSMFSLYVAQYNGQWPAYPGDMSSLWEQPLAFRDALVSTITAQPTGRTVE